MLDRDCGSVRNPCRGGAWDITFTDSDDRPEDLLTDYSVRRKKTGKKLFLDGPHFELPKNLYP